MCIRDRSKTSHEEILYGSRCFIPNCYLPRIRLIIKKDIISIEKPFNLNDETVKHPVDTASIETWVQDLKTSVAIALLVYKPQGVITFEFSQLKKTIFF